jgi:methylated-DNA-[protein]-cysteine S-methyltransferase
MLAIWHYDSPLGGMTMTGDETALTALCFDHPAQVSVQYDIDCLSLKLPVFEETVRWLDSYFRGQAPDFMPSLRLEGTPFRQSVWEILREIPYGTTKTYGQIATQLGRMSAQAVGGAVGHNPIALIIPCHRVIGADGSLTGYAAGIERKAWLLRHEQLAKCR